MNHLRRAIILFLLLGLALPALALEPQMPSKRDRCPVCGMFVAPYPDWIATIQFRDNSQLFFDGAKDLFRYYFSLPNTNDSRTREDIAQIYLTEYYSTRLLPIDDLYLVLGSDVYGPMGHELVPVAGEEIAKSFAKDHGGTKIIRFEQLTPQLLPED
ncbi:Nitrous oxide reductase accessory protein NosL [Malonomonas rubra DSM 5091]|uniref:Nitrous oxide reductase accessory protein NosL n=1 Tax=Malonomonas rubra DSM 5091 TaxID=1122189 RepID=A0A1M6H7H3_MALRU|nr:nitrous oxide reductase accessory protein NosL [Malonomonas rubra]SHJ18158.1 Nitrous oxide reductase accessory protein NosL [Malonomonas rubra DSM 5091]